MNKAVTTDEQFVGIRVLTTEKRVMTDQDKHTSQDHWLIYKKTRMPRQPGMPSRIYPFEMEFKKQQKLNSIVQEAERKQCNAKKLQELL